MAVSPLIWGAAIVSVAAVAKVVADSRKRRKPRPSNMTVLADEDEVMGLVGTMLDLSAEGAPRTLTKPLLLLTGVPLSTATEFAKANKDIEFFWSLPENVNAVQRRRKRPEIPPQHWLYVGMPIRGEYAYNSEDEAIPKPVDPGDLQKVVKWTRMGNALSRGDRRQPGG
jgi:hypothetical protein